MNTLFVSITALIALLNLPSMPGDQATAVPAAQQTQCAEPMSALTATTSLAVADLGLTAKDCGSSCETCYCTYRNGSTCVDDHPILGACTCKCVKYKKTDRPTTPGEGGSSTPQ